jgi:polyhydroxybutyrate depolymerase
VRIVANQKSASNISSDMTGRAKKIVFGVLGIVIGLPVFLVLTALACFWMLDKTNGTIVSSGVTRRYLLYVPKTYDPSQPTPLVISFHPAATWPAVAKSISHWNDLADQYAFIVVYPAGSGAFFGGLGPGPQVFPMEPETLGRDLRFISDLIDQLERKYNVDANRLYVNGMSNGGGMAFVLSCQLPDRIAAVGVVAGALPESEDHCADSKPVPTVVFHGTADKLAPYHGGTSPIAPRPFANIPEWTARLAQRNQCAGDSIDTRVAPHVRRRTYSNCAGNAEVTLYTIEGGGHTWPGAKPAPEWWAGHTTDEINATHVMWQFFVQHPRAPN